MGRSHQDLPSNASHTRSNYVAGSQLFLEPSCAFGLTLFSHSLSSYSLFFLFLRLIFSSCHSCRHLPPITKSPLNLVTRGWSGNCSTCSSLLFSPPIIIAHKVLAAFKQHSSYSHRTFLLVFFSSLNIFVSKHSLLLLFFLNPQIVCPNNFELKSNIYKEYDQNLLCGFGP